MKVGSIVEKIPYRGSSITPKDVLAKLRANGFQFPVNGNTYTVRGLDAEDGSVLLEEIVNDTYYIIDTGRYEEPAFCITMFRELLPPQAIEELIGDALTAPVKHRELQLIER